MNPFALPDLIVTVIDLPMPPSTNRIWRHGRGRFFISEKYQDWKHRADMVAIATRRAPFRTIKGRFTAEILLSEKYWRTSDADNRIKAILDYAQSRELVANDKFAQRVTVEWTQHANAPEGCRLTLRELSVALPA